MAKISAPSIFLYAVSNRPADPILEAHMNDCRAKAMRMGFRTVREFIDTDVNLETPLGTRPQGKQLLDAVAKGEADRVIAYSSNKLCPDLADYLAFRVALKRSGVDFYTVCDNSQNVLHF